MALFLDRIGPGLRVDHDEEAERAKALEALRTRVNQFPDKPGWHELAGKPAWDGDWGYDNVSIDFGPHPAPPVRR